MRTNRETLLCRYHYDALDRLAVCTPAEQASTGRFYQKNRLATEIQDLMQHSIFQHDDQLLAQHQRQGGTVATTLLLTDQQRSVLNALEATPPRSRAYTPYGHRPVGNGLLSLLGFNGERPDPVTGHYHLGNGYRQFNPVLMRFNSPDSWSPFGKGGVNAYAYCAGNPINRVDPTGHVLDELVKLLTAQSDGFRSGDSFIKTLSKIHRQVGDDKILLRAAEAEISPDFYLTNRTVNYIIDISRAKVSSYKASVNAQTTTDQVLRDYSEIAVIISDYRGIYANLKKHPDLLDEATKGRLEEWVGKVWKWPSKTRKIANDKISNLTRAQYSPLPSYSEYDPFSSPPNIVSNIRQP